MLVSRSFGFGSATGHGYYAQDYCNRISCDHGRVVLRVLKTLLTADVTCRETALEIASALAYLHSLHILHGDLSGGNILLTSSNKDSRKFTCKVRLPSANACSGRAALCASHA